jgi:hypothetical protein
VGDKIGDRWSRGKQSRDRGMSKPWVESIELISVSVVVELSQKRLYSKLYVVNYGLEIYRSS